MIIDNLYKEGYAYLIMNYEEEKQLKGIPAVNTHKTFWLFFFGIVFVGVFVTMYLIFTGVYEKKMTGEDGNIPGSSVGDLNPYDEFSGEDYPEGSYPHENPNCKLYFVDNFQEISLQLDSSDPDKNSMLILVRGYSDSKKVYWEVEDSSVLKLKPAVGASSKVTALKIGKTMITVKDTSMDSCQLQLPFEVLPYQE